MLEELRISNFAVVEDAVITFGTGLNVLTGSTGTGKSIILTAVELLSGKRARRSYVRSGAAVLTIEGIFRLPAKSPLRRAFGLGAGEDTLSIRREVTAAGRSRTLINGVLSSASAAAEATSALIEQHGQNRQQELLDPASHMTYLDGAGRHGQFLEKCNELTAKFRESWNTLKRLSDEERNARSQEEFLRFRLAELEALGLEPGLAESLQRTITRLENADRYRASLREAAERLVGGDGAALDALAAAERLLASIADIDAGWREAAREIAEIRIRAGELGRAIQRASGDEEYGTEDLEALQGRLAAIQGAARRYRTDPDGLVTERERIKGILADLEEGSSEIRAAQRRLACIREELFPAFERLSGERRSTAGRLDAGVTAELEKLGIRGALFSTRIRRKEIYALQPGGDTLDLANGGWDDVEFMIRTNVGEELHPLAEIASGGELSRVTLVLRRLLARGKGVQTLVFDEIDAGLGADLGAVVAEQLVELARGYQVICITHMPQIAAVSRHHIAVRKEIEGGRTRTAATVLSAAQRTAEIARMLGGGGDLTERLAAEMLDRDVRP